MRVICIDKPTEYYGERPYWYSPEVGDIVEVIEVKQYYGQAYYDLAGYPEFLYDARSFATLPEPDADETKEVENEAIVNLQPA
jgi:hypothetical protein